MPAQASATARAAERPDARRPNRFFVLLGLGVGAALLAVYELLPEAPLLPGDVNIRVGRYFAVMMGLYVAVVPILSRMGADDVGRIAGLVPKRRAAFQREVRTPSLLWLLIVGAVGLVIHLSILSMYGFGPELVDEPHERWSSRGFVFVMGWVHLVGFAFSVALALTQGTLFTRIARELPQVDLFDHGGLAPFVRLAQRLALFIAITIALSTAFHFDWSQGVFAPQTVLLLPLSAAVLAMTFLFPLWGTHESLRDARRDELRRVHAALRGEPEAFRGSPLLGAAERLGAVDLLTYRAQIQSLGTWPIDASSIQRLGLYLIIPLVGWIGGALVERVVDAFLD